MLGIVAFVVAASWNIAFWLQTMRTEAGPLTEARAIYVPHGGIDQIAKSLAQDGAIADPLRFRIAWWLSRQDGPLRAGEFAFPQHASLDSVLHVLRTAKPVVHRLTIPEGLTASRILAIVAKAEVATGEPGDIAEGTILPGTYNYEYGTPRATLVGRAKDAMAKALDGMWSGRDAGSPLTSARDALVLASIVEKETAKAEERAHVASVYLNRLRIGMKLQADPTVVFMASNGSGVLDHPILRSELDRDDPYNTYRVVGLPPGPICAPGVASLHAVLHPEPSSDLYFVADGAGGHTFAATREAHERNVAKWRALKAAQPRPQRE